MIMCQLELEAAYFQRAGKLELILREPGSSFLLQATGDRIFSGWLVNIVQEMIYISFKFFF